MLMVICTLYQAFRGPKCIHLQESSVHIGIMPIYNCNSYTASHLIYVIKTDSTNYIGSAQARCPSS